MLDFLLSDFLCFLLPNLFCHFALFCFVWHLDVGYLLRNIFQTKKLFEVLAMCVCVRLTIRTKTITIAIIMDGIKRTAKKKSKLCMNTLRHRWMGKKKAANNYLQLVESFNYYFRWSDYLFLWFGSSAHVMVIFHSRMTFLSLWKFIIMAAHHRWAQWKRQKISKQSRHWTAIFGFVCGIFIVIGK